MRLTKSAVDSLELISSGQTFFWDDVLKGFGIRLTPTAKTYVVQGRVNGKNRRVSIGRHGVVTAEQARKKAMAVLSEMNGGKDPSIEKKRQKTLSLTLQEVSEDYIRDRRKLKPSSIADIRKHLRTTFSDWSNKPVTSITRDKVRAKFRERSDVSPAQANQGFRILRALLNYARATYRPDDKPILPENPVAILHDANMWNTVNPRNDKIPKDRIGAAWNWIEKQRRASDQTVTSRTIADCLAFLLLTGARIGEAVTLRWDHVDLEDGHFRLDDPKNRSAITLPISRTLVEILLQRPRTNEYVFPGRSGGYLKDPRGMLEKMTETAGLRVRPHDLRRTFRAIAAEAKVEFWRTKLLMNHKPGTDVTLTNYTETEDVRYLREDTEKITAWVLQQAKIADAENVIPIERARRRQKGA